MTRTPTPARAATCSGKLRRPNRSSWPRWEKQVTAATPPTLLIHTQEDQSVPVENSILFYQALTRARGAAEMYLFEHGSHGMGMKPDFGTASAWPQRAGSGCGSAACSSPPGSSARPTRSARACADGQYMIDLNHIVSLPDRPCACPSISLTAAARKLRHLIRCDGFLPVNVICQRLGVSAATARRDLVAVEANGHITRTYGGALADYNSAFASHDERSGRARPAKARIAEKLLCKCRARALSFSTRARPSMRGPDAHAARRPDRPHRGDQQSGGGLRPRRRPGHQAPRGRGRISTAGGPTARRAIKALESCLFDAAFLGGEGTMPPASATHTPV